MAILYHKDRVKQAVSAGGTGALTLGSASSGYQALAVGDDGRLFPYVIEDGTAWETGYGTYTHSGTSFARTTRHDSSTGAALNVTTSAYLLVSWTATSTTAVGGDVFSTLSEADISVTGATTATFSRMHVCSGTTADYTLTLPAASGNAGKFIGVRMALGLTKFVTVNSVLMWAEESVTLLSNGTNWIGYNKVRRQMSCIMRRNANQTGVVTATVTKVSLNATDSDPTGAMGDTTNNRINILRAATYIPIGNVVWQALLTANSNRTITQVTKNAGATVIGNSEAFGVLGGYPSIQAVTPGVALVAGDYVELRGFHTTGVNQAFYGHATEATTNLGLLEQPTW